MKKKASKSAWVKKEKLEQLTEWAADGLSMRDIATNMGIGRSTLYKWASDDDRIMDALMCGRARACEIVENALFKKCVGYTVIVKKAFKIRKKYYDENGKQCEKDEIELHDEEVYIQPDTAAQKFFLVNNMPEKYKNSPTESKEDEGGGVVMMPEVIEIEGSKDE